MYAHSIGACLILLGLRALAGLAEEAKEGFGGRLGDSVLPGPCTRKSISTPLSTPSMLHQTTKRTPDPTQQRPGRKSASWPYAG